MALPAMAEGETACALDRIDLRWTDGTISEGTSFVVELADSPDERSQGLMFRSSLAPDAGMLFAYDSPRHVSIWMKNTLIALDIIFADEAGRVTRVHSNAVPGDLTHIDSGSNVLLVLEINGGVAEHLGIVPGAELRHPMVPENSAAWPCAE